MGRTIPSFRLLIDIEKIEWRLFRKLLCKEDKKGFDKLFSVPKLYCHSLSNLSKPIIIESIIISILFYNFKILKKITEKSSSIMVKDKDDDTINQNNLESIQLDKKQTKKENGDIYTYYSQIIEDWKKFCVCLSEDDKNTFVDMITDCYNSYYKSINSNIKEEKSDSCLTRTISLFMALILYQQKQINLIKSKVFSINL
jgi:hypothetical protein